MAAHRYWRINFLTAAASGGTGTVNVQECEMALTVSGADECTGGTATASTAVGGRAATAAFDNSSGATSFWAASGALPQWLQYDFGSGNAKDLREIRLAAPSAARAPQTFEVLYSDDNVTFTLAKAYSKLTSWSPFVLNFYSFPLPTAVAVSVAPPAGVVGGGTAVTVTGTGFTGATGVTFAGTPGTSFTVVNDTTITVTTPAHALGTVSLIVQHPYGDASPINFNYGGVDLETHVTQTPILFAYLPIQNARATQVPILVGDLPTPVPLPMPIVPEVPLKETWAWNTVINIADRAKEQRAALRGSPRYGLEFTVVSTDETQRRAIYQLLFSYINKTFPYPFYQYSTRVTAAASLGATSLFFDPARTDLRDGEQLALFDPRLEVTRYATITTVESDGATVEPLEVAVPVGWLVCPVVTMRPVGELALGMRAIAGSSNLRFESTIPRVFERPGASPSLETLDGMIVLENRPMADDDVIDGFDMNVTWLDNGVAPPLPLTNWRAPFAGGNRSYKMQRPADLDYWRGVAANLTGMLNPFLVPTYRDDFPLVSTPAPGATRLVSSNVQYFEYWRQFAYRYIRIDATDGVIYRRILNVTMNYDAVTGQPASVNLNLNSGIGGGTINRISFMPICRLGTDQITLEHQAHDSIITLPIRAINE